MEWQAMKLSNALFLLTFVFSCADLSAEAREWNDRTGDFSITGEFIRFENGKVYIKKADGELVGVPIEKLSYADCDYLRTVPEMKSYLHSNPIPTEHSVFNTVFVRGFQDLTFSPNNRFMVGATKKGVFWLDLEIKSFVLIPVPNAPFSYLNFAKYTPDGKTLVTTSGTASNVTTWKVDSDGRLSHDRTFTSPHNRFRIRSMAFDPDGQHVISGDERSTVCYWNLKTGEPKYIFEKIFAGVVGGCFVNSKGTQAVCADGKSAILFDLQLGKPIQKMELTNTTLFRTDVSRDGRRVYAEHSGTVYGWTTLDGQGRLQFKPQGSGLVWRLVSSSDGNFLLVGRSNSFDLWNTATGQHVHNYHTTSGPHNNVMAISQDNKLIAVASGMSGEYLQIFRNLAMPD
jgi:WD40 repeat protein